MVFSLHIIPPREEISSETFNLFEGSFGGRNSSQDVNWKGLEDIFDKSYPSSITKHLGLPSSNLRDDFRDHRSEVDDPFSSNIKWTTMIRNRTLFKSKTNVFTLLTLSWGI